MTQLTHETASPNQNIITPLNKSSSSSLPIKAVRIPPHRRTSIRKYWIDIYTPLVKHCGLEVRMNTKRHQVEMRLPPGSTNDPAILTKAAEFVRAIVLGFLPADALAILRLDDIFIHTFDIKQVRILHGDALGRAVGRVSGSRGRTKYHLENLTRTRIVIADTVVHIMGTVENVKVCRDAITDLIKGSPASTVLSRYKTVMDRITEAFS